MLYGYDYYQFIKEKTAMSTNYKNKCIAEQNSLDIAWNLLMSDRYNTLRQKIFHSQEELLRFRQQIIVNTVLATEILDKE